MLRLFALSAGCPRARSAVHCRALPSMCLPRAQAREEHARGGVAAAMAERDALQQQLVEAQEGLAGAELRASAAEAAREKAEVVASLCLPALWLLSLSGSRRCAGPPARCRVAPVVGLPRAQAQHEQARREAQEGAAEKDALQREQLRLQQDLAGMERRALAAEAAREKAEMVLPCSHVYMPAPDRA